MSPVLSFLMGFNIKNIKKKKEFQKAVEMNTWAHSTAIKLPEVFFFFFFFFLPRVILLTSKCDISLLFKNTSMAPDWQQGKK